MIEIILFIVAICYAIQKTIRKVKKENMSKIDFSKEKGYYREILKEYSIAELSYIDDFSVKIPREIVATLLNLKQKKRIDIRQDEIVIIDNDFQGLKKTERYILKNIKDGRVQIEEASYIKLYAQDEAIEDKLIEKTSKEKENKRIKKIFFEKVVKGIGIFGLFIILCNNIEKLNQIDNDIIMFLFALLLLALGCFFIYYFIVSPVIISTYSIMQSFSYGRTEKGEELNEKIEGLKQYIKDYSLLNQRQKEDLDVWEEYLIYSVLFNINSTKIVEEISKLIDYKTIRVYFEKNC